MASLLTFLDHLMHHKLLYCTKITSSVDKLLSFLGIMLVAIGRRDFKVPIQLCNFSLILTILQHASLQQYENLFFVSKSSFNRCCMPVNRAWMLKSWFNGLC